MAGNSVGLCKCYWQRLTDPNRVRTKPKLPQSIILTTSYAWTNHCAQHFLYWTRCLLLSIQHHHRRIREIWRLYYRPNILVALWHNEKNYIIKWDNYMTSLVIPLIKRDINSIISEMDLNDYFIDSCDISEKGVGDIVGNKW